MSTTPVAAITNRLLSVLPEAEGQYFLQDCELVRLGTAEVLFEPGDRIEHIYFPTCGVIALMARIEDHASLGMGLIGDEGMLGLSFMLGVDVQAQLAIVQCEGLALRMDANLFRRELERYPLLAGVLDRYLDVVMNQFAQTAACAHFHCVLARLASWLLMTRNRTHSDRFHLTHEVLAHMLGVRRVGVTNAATTLQNHHLISYRRGDITILDSDGLEAVSCGCYKLEKVAFSSARP